MTKDPIEEGMGKALEEMKPHELVRYITNFQQEINGLQLPSAPQADLSVMKTFQRDYGPERAAAVLRFLFSKNGGKYEVVRDREVITHRHFSKGLRWWTDKIDLTLQTSAQAEKEVATDFTFAEDL